MTDWCILRTSGRSTLGLAASLAKDGFDVWTPVETTTERVPKANVRREVRRPIMPTYVFARVAHIHELSELARMPVKPRRGAGLREPAHANFTVLHAFGKIPLVAERDFRNLRRIEAKRTPVKRAAYSFPRNSAVRVEGGSFGGMVGKVERSDSGHTLICFNGKFLVKIPTSLLSLDEIKDER